MFAGSDYTKSRSRSRRNLTDNPASGFQITGDGLVSRISPIGPIGQIGP